tara:strand:- start:145 stop:537 length:393 start_codon:yes stop_codon:yes gene_type:complete
MTKREVLIVTICAVVVFLVVGLLYQLSDDLASRTGPPADELQQQIEEELRKELEPPPNKKEEGGDKKEEGGGKEEPDEKPAEKQEPINDNYGTQIMVEQVSVEEESLKVQGSAKKALEGIKRPGPIQQIP